MPQEDKDNGQAKKCLEVFRMAFVANHESAEIEQPAEGPFYFQTADLPAQGTCALGQPTFPS